MSEKEVIERFKEIVNNLINSGVINEQYRVLINEKIDSTDEKYLVDLIISNGLLNVENTRVFISNLLETIYSTQRVDLNEFFYIIISGGDISFHFAPLDASSLMNREGIKLLHNQFGDAMKKIVEVVREREDIKTISAVSHLIKKMFASWFQEYGFQVVVKPIDEAKNDPSLGQYYERFKNYNNKSYSSIGMARIDANEFVKLNGDNMSL